MGLREKRPGALAQLRQRVQRLVRAGFRTEVSQVLAASSTKLVADEFRAEKDPYGNAWKALAKGTRPAAKRARAKILRRTGRMAASAAAVADRGGFRFHMAFPAPVHQNGGTVAPHSRLGGHFVYRSPRSGRYQSARSRRARLVERAGRSTYAQGITIPRRQMLPTKATGGLGPIWGRTFNRDAGALIRRVMGRT